MSVRAAREVTVMTHAPPLAIRLYRAFVSILAMSVLIMFAPFLAAAFAYGRINAIQRRYQDERYLAEQLAAIRSRSRNARLAFEADLDAIKRMRGVFVSTVKSEREACVAFALMTAHVEALLRERSRHMQPRSNSQA
jgi:predicted glycoside hydrolase/deacetylase ChbG (UPF0249 family)